MSKFKPYLVTWHRFERKARAFDTLAEARTFKKEMEGHGASVAIYKLVETTKVK